MEIREPPASSTQTTHPCRAAKPPEAEQENPPRAAKEEGKTIYLLSFPTPTERFEDPIESAFLQVAVFYRMARWFRHEKEWEKEKKNLMKNKVALDLVKRLFKDTSQPKSFIHTHGSLKV